MPGALYERWYNRVRGSHRTGRFMSRYQRTQDRRRFPPTDALCLVVNYCLRARYAAAVDASTMKGASFSAAVEGSVSEGLKTNAPSIATDEKRWPSINANVSPFPKSLTRFSGGGRSFFSQHKCTVEVTKLCIVRETEGSEMNPAGTRVAESAWYI